MRLLVFVLVAGWLFSGWPKMPEAQAAVSLRGTPKLTTGANGADITLTFDTGAGVPQTGDVVIFFGGHGSDGVGTAFGPSTTGYTLIASTNGADVQIGAWYKVMLATPDLTVTGIGGDDTGDSVAYGAYVIDGTTLDAAIFDQTATMVGQVTGVPDGPAIVTQTAGAMVITLAGEMVNDATAGTVTGYENYVMGSTNDSDDCGLAAATKIVASPGIEDPDAWSGWVSTNYIAITIALKPPPQDSDSAVEVHGGGAQANFNLDPLNDTSGEKFSVLKFQISDKATTDALPTLIDQIIIPISGTGGNASTDIAWAELYDDTGTAQVAVATSITNSAITFGSTPDGGGTAGLDTIASAGTIRYTLNVYMKDSALTAIDGQTYIFGINDSNVGTDTSISSSQMRGNAGAVTNVTGTITVIHSQLTFTTQPPATALVDTDFTGTIGVSATDVNNNVDKDFTENITLSAVIDITHAAPNGTLSSTDAGGLTKTATNGTTTWTDTKYSYTETIDIKAVSTTYSSGIYSSAIVTTNEITKSFQDGVFPTAGYTGTRDVELDSRSPTSPIGNATDLSIAGDTDGTRNPIIKWDISTIPAGSTVNSVSITLKTTDNASPESFPVYEMLRGDWAELTATWDTYDGTNAWGTAGAINTTTDRGTTILATVYGSALNTFYTFNLTAAGVNLVQSWVNSSSANYGITMQYPGSGNVIHYYSREIATATDRPKLTIVYTPPSLVTTISSAASQTFAVNQPATAISTITITDNATPTITAANNIRIKIPATFNMTWDTSDTLANIAGTDWAKTGAASSGSTVTVTFEDGNKTVVIPVTADFEGGDDIIVYGLSFTSFSAVSSADNLELVVAGSGGATVAYDSKTKTIVAPTISSAANQTFTVNQSATAISTITITDGATPAITAINDIRIKIPSTFNMTWDETDATATITMAPTLADYANSYNTNDLPVATLDVSDITYNPLTDTIFVVENGTPQIFEYTLGGTHLRTISMTGFLDPEGIDWMYGTTYAVSQERTTDPYIVIFTIDAGTTSVTRSEGTTITPDITITDNNGMEGISYDSDNDWFYVAVEKQADGSNGGRVFKVEMNGTTTELTALGTALSNAGYTDLGSLAYDRISGHLFLLGQENNIIIEATTAGTIVGTRNVDTGIFTQPEGLAFSPDGNSMFIVGEADDYQHLTRTSKISPTVSFEDSNKTMVVNVTSNFSGGEILSISDLSFKSFSAASVADNLELVVAGAGGATVAYDNKTVTITGSSFSTAIEVRAQDYTTTVSNIIFPEGGSGSTISAPYNNVDGSGSAQSFGGAGTAKPVITLYNGSGSSLIVWYNITTFTNGVVSDEYYLVNAKGAACADASCITGSATFDADTTTGTTIAVGAGNEKDFYLNTILSAMAGKTGSSTLTILGEAL